MFFYSRINSDFGSIETQKCFKYLSVQIDRNLNFDEQLNKTSKKMIYVLGSKYLIRN